MSNFEGHARSNSVLVKDIDGLRKSLSEYDIEIKDDSDGYYIFYADNQIVSLINKNDVSKNLDPQIDIIPYLEDDEILIIIECGNEKLRYLHGGAYAYKKNYEPIEIRTDNIYDLIYKNWHTKNFTFAHT